MRRVRRMLTVAALLLALPSAVWAHHQAFTGRAVYYSDKYAGDTMACGGVYRPYKLIAAHRSLPCGTRLKVRNLSNDRTVRVTVSDRGPFDEDYVLDLSRRAAKKLRYLSAGTARVRAVVLHD